MLTKQNDIQNFIFESGSELFELSGTSESSSEYSTISEESEIELEKGSTVSVDLQNEFLVQNNGTDITNGKHQNQDMTTNRVAANQKSRKKVSNRYYNIEWKDDKPYRRIDSTSFFWKTRMQFRHSF